MIYFESVCSFQCKITIICIFVKEAVKGSSFFPQATEQCTLVSIFLLEERAGEGIATEDTNTTERRERKTLRRGKKMAAIPLLTVGNCFYFKTPP